MSHFFLRLASFVAGALALCGCGYYALCCYSAARFRREVLREKTAGPDKSTFAPPVSILKPLRGADREMYGSFRSHCLQDYPEYEIVFGVIEPDDPAIALVERLKREFPKRRIELVFCQQKLGANMKVSTLLQILREARFEHIVVNDSDIRVGTDYLREVMATLEGPRVGLATALYRGVPGRTLWSKLEGLGIETDFAAGVLSAKVVEGGISFGLGSTLAFTRETLHAIGGFEPLLDYLGDDYELGKRIADAGYKVALSPAIVETFVADYTFRGYWSHQLRWMRTVRTSRRGGYAGLVFTFGLPFAIAALVLSGAAWWSGWLLGLALVLRLVMAAQMAGAMADRKLKRYLWLIPLRDTMAVAVWVAGFLGNTIVWRDNEFRLRNGKLEPLSRPTARV